MENKFTKYKGKNHIQKACMLLGEDILEHDLIVGDTKTINKILTSKNFKEIIKIFEERQKQVYGKALSLPGGGRDLYKRYYFENHPDFVLK